MSTGAFGENFPYTNFHELNLDWVIQKIADLNTKFDVAITSKITFADPLQWSITSQYPALTIVMDENNAYLSMQPVPSGISIADTNYWQRIFDMTELEEQISDLETELDDKIGNLETELDEKINNLETDINGQIEDIQNVLDNDVVKTNNTKTMLYLGDSYSTFYDSQLFNYVKNNIGIPPDNVYSVAVSGSSFSDPSNSYLQQLVNYAGDKTAITDILIVGGINDALAAFDNYTTANPDVSVLTNAMDAFKSYANINYPNAKIHIAYVGGCLTTSTMYSIHPAKSQEWAFWAYTVHGSDIGFNVLQDVWNIIHLGKAQYNSDGIHPSSNYGIPSIGAAICAAFNNKAVCANRPTLIKTIESSGIGIRSIQGWVRILNNMAEFVLPEHFIQLQPNSVITNEWFEVLKVNDLADFNLRGSVYYPMNVSLSGFTELSAPKQVPAVMRIEDGIIYLKVFNLVGTTYQSLTAGSFAAVTMYGMNPIIVPIWQIN